MSEPRSEHARTLEESRRSILLVEDDLQVRELWKELLRREGYAVTTTRTAEEMLRAVGSRKPDIVIADLKLPDAAGLEVIELLQGRGCLAPIIVTTGSAELVRGDAEVAAWLTKPVTVPRLLAALGRLEQLPEKTGVGSAPVSRAGRRPATSRQGGSSVVAPDDGEEHAMQPDAELRVRTIGVSEIRIGDRVIGPSARLVFGCLLFLSLARKPVGRDRLCELLWSETGKSARKRLRRLLTDVRALGVVLAPDDDEWVGLDNAHLRLDVDDVASIALSDVGSILAGISGRPPFKRWVSGVREAIEDSLVAHLLAVLREHQAAGRWEAVEDVARAILRVDGINEEATLALATAACFLGRTHRALRVLDEYVARVRGDWPADPSVEAAVTEFRERIAAAQAADKDRALPGPFAGRSVHLAAAEAALLRARSGDGGEVLWLSGPERIGKTRLLQEIGLRAYIMNVAVVQVMGRDTAEGSALSTVCALASDLRRMPGWGGTNPRHLRTIDAMLAAGEFRVTEGSGTATPIDIGVALVDLLCAVTEERPILIVADDADRLSATEREIVGTVLGQLAGVRAAWFLASREPPDAAAGWRQDIPHLRVGPLDAAESEWFVRELLADDDAGANAEELIGTVDSLCLGYPWIVAELVAAWRWPGVVEVLPASVAAFVSRVRGAARDAPQGPREPHRESVPEHRTAEDRPASAALRLADLTQVQQFVAQLAANGCKRAEMAKLVTEKFGHHVSPKTIDTHIRHIAARLPPSEGTATARVRAWLRGER